MRSDDSLIALMLARFDRGFASRVAFLVVDSHRIDELYALAIGRFDKWGLSTSQVGNVIFRAAYVLEYIYFDYNECFDSYEMRFVEDFAQTKNASARRHFAKIMAHLLMRKDSILAVMSDSQTQATAEAAALWAVDTGMRVAVRIWSVEVLIALRSRVEWVSGVLEDIFETMEREPTPALECRLRLWRTMV